MKEEGGIGTFEKDTERQRQSEAEVEKRKNETGCIHKP